MKTIIQRVLGRSLRRRLRAILFARVRFGSGSCVSEVIAAFRASLAGIVGADRLGLMAILAARYGVPRNSACRRRLFLTFDSTVRHNSYALFKRLVWGFW